MVDWVTFVFLLIKNSFKIHSEKTAIHENYELLTFKALKMQIISATSVIASYPQSPANFICTIAHASRLRLLIIDANGFRATTSG